MVNINSFTGKPPTLATGWYNVTGNPSSLMYIDESDNTYNYAIVIYIHGGTLPNIDTANPCTSNPITDCGTSNTLFPCIMSGTTNKDGSSPVSLVTVPDSVINNAINSLLLGTTCNTDQYKLPVIGCIKKEYTYIGTAAVLAFLLLRK